MGRMTRVLGALVFLLLPARSGNAGNNAGASAALSWSKEQAVSNLAAVPSQRFPLYLRLTGLTDVVKLGVDLRWS
jgi:hypothetical protein